MASTALPILRFVVIFFSVIHANHSLLRRTLIAIQLNQIGHLPRSLISHNAYTKGCYKLNFFCTMMKIKTYKHETMKQLKLSHFSINGFEFCKQQKQQRQ